MLYEPRNTVYKTLLFSKKIIFSAFDSGDNYCFNLADVYYYNYTTIC